MSSTPPLLPPLVAVQCFAISDIRWKNRKKDVAVPLVSCHDLRAVLSLLSQGKQTATRHAGRSAGCALYSKQGHLFSFAPRTTDATRHAGRSVGCALYSKQGHLSFLCSQENRCDKACRKKRWLCSLFRTGHLSFLCSQENRCDKACRKKRWLCSLFRTGPPLFSLPPGKRTATRHAGSSTMFPLLFIRTGPSLLNPPKMSCGKPSTVADLLLQQGSPLNNSSPFLKPTTKTRHLIIHKKMGTPFHTFCGTYHNLLHQKN